MGSKSFVVTLRKLLCNSLVFLPFSYWHRVGYMKETANRQQKQHHGATQLECKQMLDGKGMLGRQQWKNRCYEQNIYISILFKLYTIIEWRDFKLRQGTKITYRKEQQLELCKHFPYERHKKKKSGSKYLKYEQEEPTSPDIFCFLRNK